MSPFRLPLLACLLIASSLSVLGCSSGPKVESFRPWDTGAAGQQIPLRDFFRNPERGNFLVSDGGRFVSFLAPYKSRMNVFIQPIGSQKPPRRITSVADRDIADVLWKGDEMIVYRKDFGGDENFHFFAIPVDGHGQAKDLTPFPKVRAELVDDLRYLSKNEILVAMNKRNPEVFDVYRVNIKSGKLSLVAENPGKVTQWITDHEGKVRGAIETDGVNRVYFYRDTDHGPFQKVFSTNYRQNLSPLFFAFDSPTVVYAASNLGRDKNALVRFDLKTGKELDVVYQPADVDLDDAEYSRSRKTLTFASFLTWKREFHFFDPKTESIFEKASYRLPGLELRLIHTDKSERYYVLFALSDRSRGSYHLFDTQTGKLDKLADVAPWLKEGDLAEIRPIRYLSRDGLTIHGYLTLPRGKKPRLLPVIVNPHGGPWHRDQWGFNSQVQFLANRGYAVLQMNFRGSTGYGRAFWEASFKEWGRKMQDDITDGVKWLIATGVADPKRIAIYGGSYGGYATLAGMTFTPELYACGVDYVGVSNLFTFLKTIPPYWKPELEMFYDMIGNPEKDKELLAAASPALHTDRIRAPLFVAQGAKDPRVNINESNQIVEGLKKRGIDVPYLVKENEGHGFRNEENRIEFYEAMEKFLARHLKPEN